MDKKWKVLIYLLLAMALSGCAKNPESGVVSGKLLVATLRVAGRISPIDTADPSVRRYYFVAIDVDNDQNTGPWAVVGPPYGGNGWVTSADPVNNVGLTSYFVMSPEDPNGNVYGILPGSYFLGTTAPRPPIRCEIIESGAAMQVIIDLGQLATPTTSAENIRQLNINFITTNQLAVNPSYQYPYREWDSLGIGGQDYISIDTDQSTTWSGEDERGDVSDPDLDIINWSVEIQQP